MTVENHSIQSCFKEDDIEKDQRRLNLLNDPNYGIVLCFLDKFQSILNLPNYPLQFFEDHLLNYQEQNPSRLIDFHFILLKRLSLAKNAQRDKFDSIITKFASRFDANDGEHLKTIGYLQADIHLKIRIIKNLLESQFDLNQTLRNTFINKSSYEIKSLPLGRDRFGVSYWFFMDNYCFVRLFREDVDVDRTWTNVAKNRDELEKFIKLLITDSVVQKKFPDWIIDYEPFSSLSPSNEFQEYYSSIPVNVKEEEIEMTPTDNEISDIPTKRKRGRPKGSTKLLKEDIEITSNDDEKLNVTTKRRWRQPRCLKKSLNNKIDVLIQKEENQTRTRHGRKRNSIVDENNNNKKFKMDKDHNHQDETSMDGISLTLRRSSRFRKASTMEPISKTVSQLYNTKKKRSINHKSKVSNDLPHQRKKISRRNILSTSSSDEYNSDDYFSNSSQIDIDDHFFELDEENSNTNNEQLRTAKTAQTSTIITICCICLKNDRPEVLLLCDDCNDAYHLECLRPILLSVPDGDWFCSLCEHKKLANCLIEKFKELLINYNKVERKQITHASKQSLQRKIKIKEYSSDESITDSEFEHENDEELMLSISQIKENSNLSLQSCMDENKNNISQHGRHRRTRFDMKKILNNSDLDDADYDSRKTNFNLQLPKKITRLLHHRDRSSIKTCSTSLHHSSVDSNDTIELNEQLNAPLVYVNSDENCHQLKIVRLWNDLQRRSRRKAANMKILNKTITSDYVDENSNVYLDDTSSPHSNHSHSINEIKDEDSTIIRTKISLVQPTTVIPINQYSSRNNVKKVNTSFDRLTRDIQFAVNEAYLLPTTTKITTKIIDKQHVKRIKNKIVSPYMTKVSFPSLLPKLSSDMYNIFKSKDCSSSSSTDLSNIILTSSSSSSLLDATGDQRAVQMTFS